MQDPTQRPNLVEVRDLHFSYDARPVLTGLTLDVPRGKVVGILGVSGCGKSTLLRLIGGQLRPASGHVDVAGSIVHQLDTTHLYVLRRKMGMMFQQSGLFTDLSVFENIAFPFREHTDLPESMIRDLVLMKLQAVGLRGAWRLRPAELSGGMTRRVNNALGVTSIIVTYDAAEALNTTDLIYLMADGVIVGQGTPDALRESTDPYVHQFVHAEPDGPVAFRYPAK